jgi:MFS family permease
MPTRNKSFKNFQYLKFCTYGFLKNLRLFEPFLMVFLLEKLNQNYSLVGSLYAIRFILRTLLEIPSGIFADAIGRKNSIVLSYSAYIASFLTFYFSKDFFVLALAMTFFGVADAFRTGTHKAMIVEYLSLKGWADLKTSYYGYTRSWSQTGSALSSIIAFFIYLLSPNLEMVFLASILPFVLGIINILSYPNYLNLEKSQDHYTALERIQLRFKESFSILLNKKNLKQLSSTSLLFGFHHAMKDYLQPILAGSGLILAIGCIQNKTGDAFQLLPVIYFLIYLVALISSRNAGRVRNKIGKDQMVVVLFSILGGIVGLLIALLNAINIQLIAIGGFFILYAIVNIQRPAVISFVSSRYNTTNMATVLSIESQLGSLIAAVLSLLGGIIAENFGIPVAIGFISALITLPPLIFGVKK